MEKSAEAESNETQIKDTRNMQWKAKGTTKSISQETMANLKHQWETKRKANEQSMRMMRIHCKTKEK